MATTIIQVMVAAPCGKREFYVESQDAEENPALFLRHVTECVEELVPAGDRAGRARVTYLDDEGDECTLLEQSVTDALCLASACDGRQDFKVLLLSVQVDGPRPGAAGALESLEAWVEPAASAEPTAERPEAQRHFEGVQVCRHHIPPGDDGQAAAVAPAGDLRAPGAEEQHSFLDVCKRGDFGTARQLIEASPLLINVQPEMRASALHHFAMQGHEEAVRYLLGRGANPTARNVDGATPPDVADDSVVGLFIPEQEGGIVLGPSRAPAADVAPAAAAAPAEGAAAEASAGAAPRRPVEEGGAPEEGHGPGTAAEADDRCCLEILRAENAHLVESCQSLVAESSRAQASADASLREAARERQRLEHELEEALARNADLLAEREKAQASLQQAHQQLQGQISQGHSASVVGCELIVGVEVHEHEGGRGDATEELGDLVAARGARSAYRLGSVCVAAAPAGTDAEAEAPVCAQVKIINDGAVEWPATTAVVCQAGPHFGVPLAPLGALGAGEACEATLDLMLPPRSEPPRSRSVWALVDVATGCPLGPLLVLDAAWQAEAP